MNMTISEKLQQIDRRLISLLSERISLLATSGAPAMQEQLLSYSPLLRQTGVPESVWNNLIVGSMAAIASTPSLRSQVKPRNITVVGGRGVMGRFFVERLVAAGHRVRILEYDDWNQADTLLGTADLALICVPFKATLATIQKVARYLPPTAILADVGSTKSSIVQAMLEHHSGAVVGLHPMFGAGVDSFVGQKVVVCPGRKLGAFQWVLDLIEADGGKLVVCTAEEHDRMMIAVQAIRHFATFSLGVFLAESGISIDRSLDFASPIYRTEINLVSRLFAQDASLYVDIMLASPDRGDAITQLAQTGDRLANLLVQGNRAALMAEFEVARQAFQSDANRSIQESNHMLNALSTFLAATEAETDDLASALAVG